MQHASGAHGSTVVKGTLEIFAFACRLLAIRRPPVRWLRLPAGKKGSWRANAYGWPIPGGDCWRLGGRWCVFVRSALLLARTRRCTVGVGRAGWVAQINSASVAQP